MHSSEKNSEAVLIIVLSNNNTSSFTDEEIAILRGVNELPQGLTSLPEPLIPYTAVIIPV